MSHSTNYGKGGIQSWLTLYLASSFKLAETVQAVYEHLTSLSHWVPDVWWNVNEDREGGDLNDELWHGRSEIRALAERHWSSIREADALLLVGSESDEPQRFTGANVEAGYAMALGKPVIVLGKVKRSAMYAPCWFADDLDDLQSLLAILDRVPR